MFSLYKSTFYQGRRVGSLKYLCGVSYHSKKQMNSLILMNDQSTQFHQSKIFFKSPGIKPPPKVKRVRPNDVEDDVPADTGDISSLIKKFEKDMTKEEFENFKNTHLKDIDPNLIENIKNNKLGESQRGEIDRLRQRLNEWSESKMDDFIEQEETLNLTKLINYFLFVMLITSYIAKERDLLYSSLTEELLADTEFELVNEVKRVKNQQVRFCEYLLNDVQLNKEQKEKVLKAMETLEHENQRNYQLFKQRSDEKISSVKVSLENVNKRYEDQMKELQHGAPLSTFENLSSEPIQKSTKKNTFM